MDAGLIGAIAGTAVGFAGGIVGTYYSIRNTNGPRERAFMAKAGVVCWATVLLFLGLLLVLPHPFGQFLWIPYGILLPLGIVYANRAQQSIRNEESQGRANPPTP